MNDRERWPRRKKPIFRMECLNPDCPWKGPRVARDRVDPGEVLTPLRPDAPFVTVYIADQPCPKCGDKVRFLDAVAVGVRRILTDAQVQELLDLHFERKLTTGQLAIRFNCCPSTVRLYIRRTGREPQNYMLKRVSIDLIHEMHEHYWAGGLSAREVGHIFGLTETTVRQHFRRNDLAIRDNKTALTLRHARRKALAS